jgi:hypothetical protein
MRNLQSNIGSPRLCAVVSAMTCVLLASCTFVIHQSQPKAPGPMQLATSLNVFFDYSSLMVEGMGGAKSEADWVAAKTAGDPDYPKTWADLKAKWEANFMQGLASGSPIPVSRAPAPSAAANVTTGPVLLAQAETTSGSENAPESGMSASGGGSIQVTTDATPARAAAPEPAAQPDFDGVLTVRVALASFKLGKYIPLYTTKSELHVANSWLASGQVVDQSNDKVDFTPTIKTPSVFQHVQTMGVQAGGRAAGFLRQRHQR